MDNGILQSIETRRNTLYAPFNLPPEAKEKAEALFERMKQMGIACKDQAEFEKLRSPKSEVR